MSRGIQPWGKLLVKAGVISLDELEEAQDFAQQSGSSLEDALIRQIGISEEEITQAKAKHFNMEYVDLTQIDIPESVVHIVPEHTARSKNVIPLEEKGDTLKVAISDPMNIEIVDELRFILDYRIEVVLASDAAIQAAIGKYYDVDERESMDSMFHELTDTQIDAPVDDGMIDDDEAIDEKSAPIIRLVHLIITEAVKLRASDIHVEPFEDRVRVRYRIDGILVERDSPPKRLLGAILSRIKILARIDIAERRRPQDGRIKISVGNKALDLRVSVLPTSHGQSVVMRILDKDNIKVGLRDMGFDDEEYKQFNGLIKRPNGIILVTGPTGSGKTTTLYAALNELNQPDRKIITAEDPVEYYLPGINQVEVRHSIGLDFARIIRAMLRQAPNVILVGEIRDKETAEMAIQASLTGHLVFSTLHTNSAPASITRLTDIGVPPYLVASSLIGVMGQRLVRVPCSECKVQYTPSEEICKMAGIPKNIVEKANFTKGKGCSHCQKSGYRGRRAIYELMTMGSKIRELTFKGASTQDIRKVAVANGMKTLYKDGMIKAIRGLTTIEEVFRVAGKGNS